jgi:hypothetical protein
MGGLGGVIGTVASVFMVTYAREMPRVLGDLKEKFEIVTGVAEKNRQAMIAENVSAINSVTAKTGDSKAYIADLTGTKVIANMKQ